MRTFVVWNKYDDKDHYVAEADDEVEAARTAEEVMEQFEPLFGKFKAECVVEVPPICISTVGNDRTVRVWMGRQENDGYRNHIFYKEVCVEDLGKYVRMLEKERIEMARKERDRMMEGES